MKRRAWRVTLGAAALVAGVVGVLTVACWGTVRDHVEAWHFQLTRETETVLPNPLWRPQQELREFVVEPDESSTMGLPQYLANCSQTAVVFESWPKFIFERRDWSAQQVIDILRAVNGYRVLEQRFPRRAYVVIRDASSIEQTAERPIPTMPQRRCPQLVEYGQGEEPEDLPSAGTERP